MASGGAVEVLMPQIPRRDDFDGLRLVIDVEQTHFEWAYDEEWREIGGVFDTTCFSDEFCGEFTGTMAGIACTDGVLVSGTVILKGNVTLEVTTGAVLQASPDIRDYRKDTHYNRYRNEQSLDRCFIYAQDQENISITGNGEINGNSEAFPNEGSIYRPMMFRFLRCRNIRIDSVKMYQSAAWNIRSGISI